MEEQKLNPQGFDQASDVVKMSILGKQQVLNQNLINLKMSKKGEYLKISLETPEGQLRINHDVMVIIDISGSMAAEAQVKGQQGVKESHGLSYLDILKHAVKTIMLNLNEKDRFSLVSYSDEARLEYKLEYMTKDNKQLAMVAIDNLQDEGSTNIWAGLQEGMDQLRESYIDGQHQSILLLTDGDPNIFPPSGFIPQLQKYKKRHQNFKPTLNTFAIGKHIDSNLLDQLALEGNGAYYFIPCPGFVGTIFVNAISNILSTMASNCELTVEALNGAKIVQIPGFPVQNKNTIMCGDIRFGQIKDILLKIQVPDDYQYIKRPILNISLKYYDYFTKQYRIGQLKDQELPDYEDLLVEAAYCRLIFVENIREVLKQFNSGNEEKARQLIVQMATEFAQIQEKQQTQMKEYNGENKEYLMFKLKISQNFIENLLKDIKGEVTLAIKSKESYNHWGKHYLPSLNHCHLRQQCNNFIDPGIQSYATNFFNEIKDLAEDTFLKMPAPKPSIKKNVENQQQQQQYPYQQQQNQQRQNQQQQGSQKQRSRTPSPQQNQNNNGNNSGGGVDMAYYYNAAGGCFEGNCIVNMADGSFKKVKEIQKGDQVMGFGDTAHTVKLVIKINCIENKQCLVKLGNGLLITPKHPVYLNGKWIKPFQAGVPQIYECTEVYNFVLSSGHVIQVNGILCVTFGHGLKEKNVEHQYFGSETIVNDLMKISQKQNHKDIIELNMKQFIRNDNNKVCGLQFE